MNSDSTYDFEKICRTCKTKSVKLHSLFSPLQKPVQLVEMLTVCTSVQVAIGDGLPSSICTECANQLNIAYNFKRQSESVDLSLRIWLKQNIIKQETLNCNSNSEANPSDIPEDKVNFYNTPLNINTTVKEEIIANKVEGTKQMIIDQKNEIIPDQSKDSKCDNLDDIKKKPNKNSKSPGTKSTYSLNEVEEIEVEVDIPTLVENVKEYKADGQLWGQFKCDICDKIFSQSSYLKKHRKRHCDEKLYECNVCKKPLKNLDSLKSHETLHSDDNLRKEDNACTIMEVSEASSEVTFPVQHFPIKLTKRRRCRVCTKTKKRTATWYVCDVCTDKGEPIGLCPDNCFKEYHINNIKQPCHKYKSLQALREKNYECKICTRKFTHSHQLTRHRRVHTGEKPFICAVCGYAFASSTQLITHSRSHTKDKPYHCTLCDKAFSTSTAQKMHELRHTGERKHACPVCGKGLTAPWDLTTHMRTHTGEKPYQCNIGTCTKKYKTSSHLAAHKRTHSGEKNHLCNICGRSFADKMQLKSHGNIHKDDRPYVCGVCGQGFKQSSSLYTHKKLHKKE